MSSPHKLAVLLAKAGNINPSRTERLTPPLSMLPGDRTESYRIRDEMIGMLGVPTCGWKIGAVAADVQKEAGYDGPIPGRILANSVFKSGDSVRMPAKEGSKIECELAIRLKTVPADWGRSKLPGLGIKELGKLIEILFAFDITASRYALDWMRRIGAQERMLAQLADNGNGGLVVVGPTLETEKLMCATSFRAELIVGEEPAAVVEKNETILDYIMPPLNWVLNHVKACRLPLKEGDLILTGSLTDPLPLAAGDKVKACFYLPGQGAGERGDETSYTLSTAVGV